MIKPTVGRIVLFKSTKETLAAIVSGVLDNGRVHLHVMTLDHRDPVVLHTNVQLLQDDDKPTGAYWAEWMDYQKGQAAKTETVTEELHKRIAQLEELVTKMTAQGAAHDQQQSS